jgi:hypothetical protein
VTGVAFSPDGRRLVSAGADKLLLVWETAAGRESFPLPWHGGAVKGVAFSDDGKRVVARGEGGEAGSWNAATGQPITPCTDPPPPDGQREAVSPDGIWRVVADQGAARVERVKDDRPPSDLVFAGRLSDRRGRFFYHIRGAAAAQQSGRWFAAAHHLRQLMLLSDPKGNVAPLRVFRFRALMLLNAADPGPLQAAALKRPAEKADPLEQALANWYDALDWPPHAVPWWLGRGTHAALLRTLLSAEERLLRAPR